MARMLGLILTAALAEVVAVLILVDFALAPLRAVAHVLEAAQ